MIDIFIIGAGPAGMTAGLYALRSGKSVTIIEKNNIGGQISGSPRVENFPTIEKISGQDLADRMFDQISNLGIDFKFGEVLKIEKEDNIFKIITEYDTFLAKSVIIANGVEHRKLNLLKEEELIGNGISYCALCDGAFYENEDVTLIGDGNTALQYALLLSNICKSVNVVTLFDKFFADKTLVNSLLKKENVIITHNAKLVELKGEEKLESLIFEKLDKTKFELKTKALFVAIGQIPQNKAYSNLVDLDEQGYFVVDENLETKTSGLFVAGDCRAKKIRQLTTACADGTISATNAITYIEKNY